MALFLSLVVCVEFVTSVVLVSATNVAVVASCTSLINDQCTQNLTSCLQPPCSLSCGRTSPQFSCSQDCVPSANLTDGYFVMHWSTKHRNIATKHATILIAILRPVHPTSAPSNALLPIAGEWSARQTSPTVIK